LRRASPWIFLKDYSNIKSGTSGEYLIFTWHVPDFNAQSVFDRNITGEGKPTITTGELTWSNVTAGLAPTGIIHYNMKRYSNLFEGYSL
jgi:hypothetical protein